MFFRKFREELKVQTFVSRVEDANYKFRTDFLQETNYHLTAAKKALADIQAAKIESKLTKVGWEYIAKVCIELKCKALSHGLDQIVRDCDYIADNAIRLIPSAPTE